jgi:hypothetical protein
MQSNFIFSHFAPYGSLKAIKLAAKVGIIGKVPAPEMDQRQVVRRNKTK